MGSNDRRRKPLTLAEAGALAALPRGPENFWCPKRPSCGPLMFGGLWDIVSSERDRPDHLCLETSQRMTAHWAGHHGGEPIPRWKDRWPLPLGRDALRLRVELDGLAVSVEPFPLLPFFEDEEAIMAERIVIGEDVLDVFGLAPMDQSTYDADGSARAWTAGRFAYSLTGYGVPGDRALKQTLTVLRATRRWWQEMIEGKPLPSSPNAGRPKGSYKGVRWSKHQLLEWWCEASERYEQDGAQPTLRDLADAIGLKSERIARARVDGAGLHWPPTAEELEAFRRERPGEIEFA